MSKIIKAEEATRAILKFSGQYGLKSVTLTTTLAQRCQSVGTLTLYAESDDAYPVVLEDVRYPNVVVRSVAQMLRINFYLRYDHTEMA
ncbi:hypothetical protein NVP2275O_214 [Vibrio phage 2.275.O._10N.286.54.E11]|nr:hypothetical protein NVP2275O_214 [Vibrio phage 2.275.O._10N.286.54.E11]